MEKITKKWGKNSKKKMIEQLLLTWWITPGRLMKMRFLLRLFFVIFLDTPINEKL